MTMEDFDQLSEYEQRDLFRFGFKPRHVPMMQFYECPKCYFSRWDNQQQKLVCTNNVITFSDCFVYEPGAGE